ncbi:MAG: recombinase family protein [Actinomycetota bacterium]|nr:recombinase family protein [Actinomycetota bacterium]
MATAAIYTRLSQDRDGTKGGTERQEKDCRALCKREGLKVATVYTDDDRSAYSGKPRPAFERMLGELDRFDAVVYWKTDRLVRRLTQFNRVLEACETANVRLVSVVDPIDTSTPILKGVAGLMASMGEQESKNISLRVTRFHEDAAARGRAHGHRRAFGYERDSMTVNKSEAKAVREARDRVLRGESMRSICSDWNARGVKPTTAPGWRVTTFKRMITGPRIAGLRQYHGEIVSKSTWPAIISPADRDAIISTLGDPKVRKRGRPASYLLTGMTRCGKCGATLRSSVRDNGLRRWSCRRLPGDESHCGRLDVRADYVDQLVEDAVLHALDSAALGRALRRGKGRKAKADAAKVAQLETRVTQLGLDHDDGIITRKEWLARRGPLLEKLDAGRADLAPENSTDVLAGFEGVNVTKRWQRLSLNERRRVVALLIECVVIAEPDRRGNTFDPDRVEITWKA